VKEDHMKNLKELNNAFATVAQTASAATVSIGRDGRASGVVVADGIVLTNAHALRSSTTQVRFADGRITQGEVQSTDLDGDLIALRVDTTGVTPPLWADNQPLLGHFVVAAHGDGSIAIATVAATGRSFPGPRGRSIANALEHTASLARGASGGPVVDIDGRLVGINTNRTDAGYQAIALTTGMKARIHALITGTSFQRKRLGVALADAQTTNAVRRAAGLPDAAGLLVRSVADESPASRAGIIQGDVLLSADGKPTLTLDALATALDTPNTLVSFEITRGVENTTISVNFSEPNTGTESETIKA
jgi:serine protease Do